MLMRDAGLSKRASWSIIYDSEVHLTNKVEKIEVMEIISVYVQMGQAPPE